MRERHRIKILCMHTDWKSVWALFVCWCACGDIIAKREMWRMRMRERDRERDRARAPAFTYNADRVSSVLLWFFFLLSYFLSFACVLFWTRRKKKNHMYRKISFVFLIELNGSAHQYTHSTHVCIHQFRMKRVAHILPTCVSHISTHFERVTTFDCTERWAVCFFLLSFFFFPSSLSFAFFFFFAFYSYCMYRCCRRCRCRRCCCCYEIMKCKAAHRLKGKDISTMQTMWTRSERFNSNNGQFKCVASTKYLDH